MQYNRERERDLHQRSVVKVLEAHIRGLDEPIPRGLTDAVSRALRAGNPAISRETLELFVRAFELSDDHAATLRRLWNGDEPPRVVVGNLPPLTGVQTDSPPYLAVLIHDFHEIGADGVPAQQRTVYGIRALQDGVTRHRYSFDTRHARVERVYGGTPSEPYRLKDAIWAVDLTLPQALNRHEETSLEYVTTFHYDYDVEPCFRRAIHQRIENVALRVAFHPDKLPRHVWRAEWQDYRLPNDRIAHKVGVELDRENAAYWRLDVVERAVVGFVWEF